MKRTMLLVAGGLPALFWASAGMVQAPADRTAKPLERIEPGLWELKNLDLSGTPIRMCARDLRLLLQPLHSGQLCGQVVSFANTDRVTVSYDCAQFGRGQTTLRVETARLVQIDSQGVMDGRPFAAVMEGRRVGACPAAAH